MTISKLFFSHFKTPGITLLFIGYDEHEGNLLISNPEFGGIVI